MYTECSQFQFIIINVESVRSPHMFLLSTLYPTFYCGSGRTKVRPFLFFCAHNAQAGIEWFVPVGARSARPGFALNGGGESCPCITDRVSPPAGGGTVSLRATDALRLAKSRRKAAVARMHARCGSRRGGLAPSCESPPPDRSLLHATANRFYQLRSENLICDYVAPVDLLLALDVQPHSDMRLFVTTVRTIPRASGHVRCNYYITVCVQTQTGLDFLALL